MEKNIINYTSTIKFPLILIVVLIHTLQDGDKFNVGGRLVFEGMASLLAFNYFIGEAVSRMAVPVFFFISGYLFFLAMGVKNNYDTTTYKQKLNRRKKSLLFPYLLWTILYIAEYIACRFFLHPEEIPHDIMWYIRAFWCVEGDGCPLLYPFWYIRDLMVLSLLSPIIYFFGKKLGSFWLFLAVLCMLLRFPLFTGLSWSDVFFFSTGAYYSLNRITEFRFYRYRWIVWTTFFCLAIIDTLVNQKLIPYSIPDIHIITIVSGFVSCLYFGKWLFVKGKTNTITFNNSILFILAFHPFILGICKKLVFYLVQSGDVFTNITLEFIVFGIVSVISLVAYYILKKSFPRVTSVLTGGR